MNLKLLLISLILLSQFADAGPRIRPNRPKPQSQKSNPLNAGPTRSEVERHQNYIQREWRNILHNLSYSVTDGLLQLPQGLNPRLEAGFQAVHSFLNSEFKILEALQKLEREVDYIAQERNLPHSEALKLVLEAHETRGGFLGPVENLKPRPYSRSEWMAMLLRGRPFNDLLFIDTNREGQPHGMLTHRIQLALVEMFIAANPALFGGVTLGELFRAMGDTQAAQQLNWEATGILPADDVVYSENGPTVIPNTAWQHLWFPLFDGFFDNFHSPEFLRRLHEFFPFLGDWSSNKKSSHLNSNA